MPKAENIETESDGDRSPFRSPFALFVIGGIFLSFVLGIVFFWTIARGRRAVEIPIDAKPNYFIHDAG